MKLIDVDEARILLQLGKIIAYPTEAVYGLGCDPFNEVAVNQLLALKKRPQEKGLILLISNWEQLSGLIDDIPSDKLAEVKKSWPGPVTWIFPKNKALPAWLTGSHNSIAIRMSAHQTAQELCKDGPLISTSANLSGEPPARSHDELVEQFPQGIAGLVAGDLGGALNPSAIFDVLTGRKLR
ncbi:L-threonylcarbamoyladenylate synthase [Legionella londiniensis]|uniref:Threonylcarbamoyl-AMP synthase n=1 Tax=Legionella londiniensis TaxID=45068 RepID=A0A0W0VSF0_9GAMM|nr:L-threonylcarbamoyladenylate synthase [Legionella londiniensis]KTD23051.1 translation initiation protein [Legionella londiniensis]STX94068.1 translation initiation protein [Legionella londiniensis]